MVNNENRIASIERWLDDEHTHLSGSTRRQTIEELALDWHEQTKRRHKRRALWNGIGQWGVALVSTGLAALSIDAEVIANILAFFRS